MQIDRHLFDEFMEASGDIQECIHFIIIDFWSKHLNSWTDKVKRWEDEEKKMDDHMKFPASHILRQKKIILTKAVTRKINHEDPEWVQHLVEGMLLLGDIPTARCLFREVLPTATKTVAELRAQTARIQKKVLGAMKTGDPDVDAAVLEKTRKEIKEKETMGGPYTKDEIRGNTATNGSQQGGLRSDRAGN